VSYLVLGLVAKFPGSTPYDMKRFVAFSIGNFWSFPHSQLYAEPERLAEAGLLREEREQTGRRRRSYWITAAGRRALREWLREPVEQPMQLRDLGLLKLFFGEFADRRDVIGLAKSQLASHSALLAEFEAIDRRLKRTPGAAYPHATLRLGLRMAHAFVEFWEEIARRPPQGRRAR
jgi:DNA-binding PadR family transcriptional regulator